MMIKQLVFADNNLLQIQSLRGLNSRLLYTHQVIYRTLQQREYFSPQKKTKTDFDNCL